MLLRRDNLKTKPGSPGPAQHLTVSVLQKDTDFGDRCAQIPVSLPYTNVSLADDEVSGAIIQPSFAPTPDPSSEKSSP